jgi:hypothetical protein
LWNILNKLKRSKREDTIYINELYEYFTNLNVSNEVGDSNFEIPYTNDNLANDTLNGEITEEEITSAIQNFKMAKHLDMSVSLVNISNQLFVHVCHCI